MDLEGNSNSGTSVAFLEQLRGRHSRRLNVIWDNAPAHRGEALREYLRTPELDLRLVNLPGHSPDFNAEEATGNLCLGPGRRYRNGSGTSWPGWPIGKMR